MRDIVENARSIVDYTHGLDLQTYGENKLVRDATERCFARISEAAVKIGPLAEELFPSHDWIAIRHLGNILRHDYHGSLNSSLWTIRTNNLQPLLTDLETFLSRYPVDQELSLIHI